MDVNVLRPQDGEHQDRQNDQDHVEQAVSVHAEQDTLLVGLPNVFARRYDGKDNVSTLDARLGRCYDLGATAHLNLAVGRFQTLLVHGMIGPMQIPHCWLEFRVEGKALIWDPVVDRVLLKREAQGRMMYRRWSWYTPWQAADHQLAEGHFGPWGKDDARYDKEVKRIEAIQDEFCSAACTRFNHTEDCGWSTMSTPLNMRGTE